MNVIQKPQLPASRRGLYCWQAGLALAAALLPNGASAQQSVVINPVTINYWVGANTTNILGVGSNSVAISGATTNLVNLAVSVPANVGAVLTPAVMTTGNTNLGVALSVTNLAANATTLSLSGSGGASYSTNVNLFVVPQWVATNSGSIGNWSSGTNWSTGAAPGPNDSVYVENQAIASFTNTVDASRTIQSLIFLGDADDNLGSGAFTQIPTGVTLSVVGTNGFAIANKSNNNSRPQYAFYGGGALVISNTSGNFSINDGSSSSSTRLTTVNMSGLSNFVAKVSRFGAGDATLSAQGLQGGALVTLSLARTNTIATTWSDDYTALNFQNAFNAGNNGEMAGGSVVCFLNLGFTNGIYTDSIGVGRSHLQGSSGVGETLRFLTTITNSGAPVASAFIRGTNGGRMTLLAVGVDSGSANSAKNTIGLVNLLGGKVDMLVDQIWLGRNRTNTANPTDSGGLNFDNGIVSANIVRAGYMEYTNAANVKGTILVGTNGLLNVGDYLELGHTPVDPTGAFAAYEILASGQLTVGGGGTARINSVIVGPGSTNNTITVNTSGSLVISNTIASPVASLGTLTLGAGNLTFFVNAGVTNAFVTNLVTSSTCTINIASLAGFSSYPATNVLIAYQTPGAHTLGIGKLPPGFNNLQIVDDPTSMTIRLIINTNQPKHLAWRGGDNSQWDHASLNWLDTNTLAVTKFTDGDVVSFDDTVGVSTNITIAENVNPGQTGTGIYATSSTNQFTFNNFGSGGIGSCALVQSGSSTLEIDCSSSIAAQINAGSLIGSGSINSASVGAGASFNFNGSDGGSLTSSGNSTIGLSGTVGGPLVINGGVVTNNGVASGALTMSPGVLLYNAGTLGAIGTAAVVTNSTLINAGSIYGASLTVNVGGTLWDDVQGYAGAASPGSINVGSLIISGTFYPGGGATGTTKVTDYLINNSEAGNPSGRVQLNTGSTTYFEVNLTNAQINTLLLSQNQGFGPSQPNKAINGGTIKIINVGPTPFAAGQSFQLFGNYYNGGVLGNAGLNTTNSYPNIIPATPGPGLSWDLSQLIPQGIVSVIDPTTVQFSLSSSTSVSSSNVVTEFAWPANVAGGWLQQLNSTLTNGLSATNWITVPGSASTTDIIVTNTIIGDPNAPGSTIFYRFVYP